MTVLVYVRGLNGLLNVGNGLYMLVDPATWYVIVPTVTGTGPFNQHFIRDIGMSHLLVGIGYLWGIAALAQRVWMWGAAASWLTLHSLFHIWEIAVGICGSDVIVPVARCLPSSRHRYGRLDLGVLKKMMQQRAYVYDF